MSSVTNAPTRSAPLSRKFSLNVQPVRGPFPPCRMLTQSTLRGRKEDPPCASSSQVPLPFAPKRQTEGIEISLKYNSFLMVLSWLRGNQFLSPETGLWRESVPYKGLGIRALFLPTHPPAPLTGGSGMLAPRAECDDIIKAQCLARLQFTNHLCVP